MEQRGTKNEKSTFLKMFTCSVYICCDVLCAQNKYTVKHLGFMQKRLRGGRYINDRGETITKQFTGMILEFV